MGAARMECHFTNARHLILDRLAIDPDETECSIAPRSGGLRNGGYE